MTSRQGTLMPDCVAGLPRPYGSVLRDVGWGFSSGISNTRVETCASSACPQPSRRIADSRRAFFLLRFEMARLRQPRRHSTKFDPRAIACPERLLVTTRRSRLGAQSPRFLDQGLPWKNTRNFPDPGTLAPLTRPSSEFGRRLSSPTIFTIPATPLILLQK